MGIINANSVPNFPMNYLCESKDGLILEFLCPKEITILAVVQYHEKKVHNSTITTRKGNTATIIIVFRKPGIYNIELFVKKPEAKKFDTALKYLVDAKITDLSRAQSKMMVPKIYSLFYDMSISLFEPLLNAFHSGDTIVFRIQSESRELESVSCIQGAKERWTYFTYKSNKMWELVINNVEKPIHIAVMLKKSETYQRYSNV